MASAPISLVPSRLARDPEPVPRRKLTTRWALLELRKMAQRTG